MRVEEEEGAMLVREDMLLGYEQSKCKQASRKGQLPAISSPYPKTHVPMSI